MTETSAVAGPGAAATATAAAATTSAATAESSRPADSGKKDGFKVKTINFSAKLATNCGFFE